MGRLDKNKLLAPNIADARTTTANAVVKSNRMARYKPARHESAEEFLDALVPTRPTFEGGEWIFRGQAVDLPLLPTAFREERMKPFVAKTQMVDWSTWTNFKQAREELRLLREFYKIADRAGLPIPEDSYDIRVLLETINNDHATFVTQWPPGKLWPIMALAQHHGVPTRLLDWTHSPWAAAYFAASEVLRKPEGERGECSIVVWAFDSDYAGAGGFDDEGLPAAPGIVEMVTTPYANNRNLAAQRGVHLLYKPTGTLLAADEAERAPLDQALQHVYTTVRDYTKALYKFVLPATEAGRVLRLISKHGATGATLFPGFDGVARAMRERWLWGRR